MKFLDVLLQSAAAAVGGYRNAPAGDSTTRARHSDLADSVEGLAAVMADLVEVNRDQLEMLEKAREEQQVD